MRRFIIVAMALLICATAEARERRTLPTISQDHECFLHRQIFCRESLNDTLNIYGCAYTNGEYFNAHVFTALKGVEVTVLLHSSQFKPFIEIVGSAFDYLVAWDPRPSSTESRVTFTTPYAGKYHILAGGERPYTTTPTIGSYALAISCTGSGTSASPGCVEVDVQRDPQNTIIPAGSTTTLDVVHSGTPPFYYRWFFGEAGDESRPVGSNATFTTPPLSATATYWVRVMNDCSVSASEHATIFTTCQGPSITTQPRNTEVFYGGTAQLTVVASGSPSLTYEWYEVPNRLLQTSGSPNFTVSNVTKTNLYFARVRNACGEVTSQNVTVSMRQPPRRRAARK